MKKILYVLSIITISSCIARTDEDIHHKMTLKLKKFDSKKVDVNYETLYKSEGLFKCTKDFKINSNKIKSTSDGQFEEFIYFYKDGKVSFVGTNIFPDYKKYIKKPSGEFSAVIFQKNNKTKIMRSQAFHSILGMDLGKGIYTENIKLKKGEVILQKSNGDCEVYKLLED